MNRCGGTCVLDRVNKDSTDLLHEGCAYKSCTGERKQPLQSIHLENIPTLTYSKTRDGQRRYSFLSFPIAWSKTATNCEYESCTGARKQPFQRTHLESISTPYTKTIDGRRLPVIAWSRTITNCEYKSCTGARKHHSSRSILKVYLLLPTTRGTAVTARSFFGCLVKNLPRLGI